MSNQEQEILLRVFSDVAESLAFMFAETPEEAEECVVTDDCFARARMEFHGPFSGSLLMAVPESMCPEIAANVLGLEPDDDLVTHQPYDALKELLNVTCGNVLTALAGETPVFDLTVPEVTRLDAPAWEALKGEAGVVCCVVDDNPALLQLETDRQ